MTQKGAGLLSKYKASTHSEKESMHSEIQSKASLAMQAEARPQDAHSGSS